MQEKKVSSRKIARKHFSVFLSGLWSQNRRVGTLAKVGVEVGFQNNIEKQESESHNLDQLLLRMELESVL